MNAISLLKVEMKTNINRGVIGSRAKYNEEQDVLAKGSSSTSLQPVIGLEHFSVSGSNDIQRLLKKQEM